MSRLFLLPVKGLVPRLDPSPYKLLHGDHAVDVTATNLAVFSITAMQLFISLLIVLIHWNVNVCC